MTPVTEAENGRRLDLVIADRLGISRSAAATHITEGRVTLNAATAQKRTIVKTGDLISVTIAEPVPSEAVAEDIPLDILYEDEDLLVINKPKGMVVHPAPGNYTGTLVNALLYHCKGQLSGIGGVLRPGIVHRIDKDTSGLLVVAKCDSAHTGLAKQLEGHHITREYHALALGGFSVAKGTVDQPIGRHPVDRKKMAVIKDGTHASKPAITHYELLRAYGGISYIKCVLETGRTHQIRTHMSYIGHPLLGDTVYGGGKSAFEREHKALLSGQALHAKKLAFRHPRTGEMMSFECELPREFQKLLDILERKNS